MPRDTWTVRIELSETDEAVYAHAVLVGGPALLTGHGRARVEEPNEVSRGRALAARRALTDLTQAMRPALERGTVVTATRS